MRSHSLMSLVLGAAVLGGACATATEPARVPVVPMGAREMQTRTLDDIDATRAMKVVIDTLQDGEFTIDRADATLGLVVGTRSTSKQVSGGETALKWTSIVFSYGLAALLPWGKSETTQLEASANVTAAGDGSRVRLTFTRRVLDGRGRVTRVEAITDPKLYQDFFELMGRSLFVAEGE